MPHKDREVRNAYARKYHQEHKEEIHAKKRVYYQRNREYLLSQTKKYQQANPERRRQWNVRFAMAHKTNVLKHYGGGSVACVECGEARIDCLSIDHINGGGNKHRHSLNLIGEKFYRWLEKQHFPLGYQTLCMNCQFIKRKFGTKESEDK